MVFGVLASSARHPGRGVALVIASSFGLFHGYAHAVEMPALVSLSGYTAGILATSLAVAGLNAALGHFLVGQGCAARLARGLGAGAAFAGAGFLIAG